MYCGVDYGSKMAGTTVVCTQDSEKGFVFAQSTKGADADRFLMDWIGNHPQIQQVFIDAPLSLPAVYQQLAGFDNYFYRQSDMALKAMSPMFLGGLTARAMKLKAQYVDSGTQFYEVYPGGLARHLDLQTQGYKKETHHIPKLIHYLKELFGITIPEMPTNWHQVDALLAALIGDRVRNNEALKYGDDTEGTIYI